MADSTGLYDVVWPRSERRTTLQPLAPRLRSLDGKRVAELWTYLYRGDEVFPMLEEGLKARYPGVEFVGWQEFGSTHSEDEREVLDSLPRRLKELGVDAVVSGMGC
ncbi:MAG: hypothetical protein HY521_13290 [Proteobacteria bacterium]|nr:hypothetical protein [Pseudomonadota bacterium]